MKKDIEIANETVTKNIKDIASQVSIPENALFLYGNDKAKVDLEYLKNLKKNKSHLILVTGINPTKFGEGKSTVTIGLADGLKAKNKKVMLCLREPSMGPVFGLKGGATGGGYSQIVPMESINLHFTGDIHAITSAHNLISAMLDNSIYQGNPLDIDIDHIVWPRCIDMNDRSLRDITIGQKKSVNGVEREDHFVITAASEIMAILCLATSLKDLQRRIGNILIAYTKDDKAIKVKDIYADGAATVLLKDALQPNLVQTLEGTAAFVHGGPFANIAHGCNSLIATKSALNLADYVVTEAGFGADLGAEKFFDIKCRVGQLKPSLVVIVATIRALKLHGGVNSELLIEENLTALEKGLCNLEKHIENMKLYGLPVVVAYNKFQTDTIKEMTFLKNWAQKKGYDLALSDGYTQGSKGMMALVEKVLSACDNNNNNFHYLYALEETIEEKIKLIASKIYGAKEIVYSDKAMQKITEIKKNNWNNLAICMAKTPMSFSDNPKLIGAPKGFTLHIQDIKVSLGAEFIVVYTGQVMTMPGLPKDPSANHIGIDEKGSTFGIF